MTLYPQSAVTVSPAIEAEAYHFINADECDDIHIHCSFHVAYKGTRNVILSKRRVLAL